MHSDIFGAACAFLAGAVIAWAGYRAQRHALKTKPDAYALVQIAKQLAQIGFLALVYLLGGRTPWDRIWLLAGGALGVTLPMIFFTVRLVKLNDTLHEKEGPEDGRGL